MSDWVSYCTTWIWRPSRPPAALISSAASCVACTIGLPYASRLPELSSTEPSLIGPPCASARVNGSARPAAAPEADARMRRRETDMVFSWKWEPDGLCVVRQLFGRGLVPVE